KYTYTVENTGNVTLNPVTFSDTKIPGPFSGCETTTGLEPGATHKLTCMAEYEVKQADINAGAIENTATAIGHAPEGAEAKDSASDDVAAEQKPVIELVKDAEQENFEAVGEKIVYHYIVKNGGNVTLKTVTLTDVPLGEITACDTAELAPGKET